MSEEATRPVVMLACALGLGGAGRRQAPGVGPRGPGSPAAAASQDHRPHVNIAPPRAGPPARSPPPARGPPSPPPSPRGWTTRAGSRLADATCWWPRRRRPPRRGQQGGARWVMKRKMKTAGSSVPSANRITLLRDPTATARRAAGGVPAGLSSPFEHVPRREDFYGPTPIPWSASVHARGHPDRRPRDQARGHCPPAHQPPLDQEPDRQPGRHQALRPPWARTATSPNAGMEVEPGRAIWEIVA